MDEMMGGRRPGRGQAEAIEEMWWCEGAEDGGGSGCGGGECDREGGQGQCRRKKCGDHKDLDSAGGRVIGRAPQAKASVPSERASAASGVGWAGRGREDVDE